MNICNCGECKEAYELGKQDGRFECSAEHEALAQRARTTLAKELSDEGWNGDFEALMERIIEIRETAKAETRQVTPKVGVGPEHEPKESGNSEEHRAVLPAADIPKSISSEVWVFITGGLCAECQNKVRDLEKSRIVKEATKGK